MASKPPKPRSSAIAVNNDLSTELATMTESLTANPNVDRFTVSVNKRTGIARATAVGGDGRTRTHEMIGPGLSSTMTYTPNDTATRDANIRALRRDGYTQQEIADRLGISQALVSKVLRG